MGFVYHRPGCKNTESVWGVFAHFDIKFDKINLGYALPPAALTSAIKSDTQDKCVVITFLFKHEYVLYILDLLLCFSFSTIYPLEHSSSFIVLSVSPVPHQHTEAASGPDVGDASGDASLLLLLLLAVVATVPKLAVKSLLIINKL